MAEAMNPPARKDALLKCNLCKYVGTGWSFVIKQSYQHHVAPSSHALCKEITTPVLPCALEMLDKSGTVHYWQESKVLHTDLNAPSKCIWCIQGHAEQGKVKRKIIENLCLHRRRLHNFFAQSVPAFDHPHNKRIFLSSNGISYFFKFVSILSCQWALLSRKYAVLSHDINTFRYLTCFRMDLSS